MVIIKVRPIKTGAILCLMLFYPLSLKLRALPCQLMQRTHLHKWTTLAHVVCITNTETFLIYHWTVTVRSSFLPLSCHFFQENRHWDYNISIFSHLRTCLFGHFSSDSFFIKALKIFVKVPLNCMVSRCNYFLESKSKWFCTSGIN